MFKNLFFIFLTILSIFSCGAQKSSNKSLATIDIMFYNLENLFDTIDDPETMDEEYLPTAEKKWDTKKYETKINNLAKVITTINNGDLPDLMGFCELEHRANIVDLQNAANAKNYAISHFESPDARGIDVALMYNKSMFKLVNEASIIVSLYQENEVLENIKNGIKSNDELEETGKTRNILKTKLLKDKDTFCVFVCHFPSRRNGKEASSFKRELVAKSLRLAVEEETKANPNVKIVIMGDFNDEPSDISIKYVLKAGIENDPEYSLYNLFYTFHVAKDGSYKYRDQMNMLDQIIISKNLWNSTIKSKIYNPDWLKQTGKYEGFPLRTFGGNNYLAGYSDHFPVFTSITY